MLKKTLKVVTVLTLLFGCYTGYVRVFALVVKHLEATQKRSSIPFVRRESKSERESTERARKALGADHWATEPNTNCYIDKGKDFWLYSRNFEQPSEKKFDGKRMILEPVALIIPTDGGKSTVTITAERGVFDCNQRLGQNNARAAKGKKAEPEPFKVLKARVERNVLLRHDRGTPDDPDDDLFVGPLTSAEFDDESLQIASDSDVLIRDREMQITGEGFRIQLRPKNEAVAATSPGDPVQPPKKGNGFEGIRTAELLKNVHVVFNDAGQTGFLPGTDKKKDRVGRLSNATTSTDKKVDDPEKSRPLDLHSAGPMLVTFPEPRVAVRVGPPAPVQPTVIEFTRDILAQVGDLDQKPDQLSCDTLELILYPAEKPEPPPSKPGDPKLASAADAIPADAEPASEESKSEGAFGNLALKTLKAKGHAVWVKVSEQTTTIQGISLTHQKGGPGELDLTYMLGQGVRGLRIVKVDYDQEGAGRKVTGLTNVWGSDATIYNREGDTDNATVVIRGPGRLETRTEPNQAAQRIAEWQDRLEVQSAPGTEPRAVAPTKMVTLIGVPLVQDISKPDNPSYLDATNRIITWLKPKAVDPSESGKTKPKGSPLSPGTSGYNIDRLVAFENVHLTSPGQNITARKRLDAEFEPVKGLVVAASPNTGAAPPAPNTPATTTPASRSTVQGSNPAQPATPPNDTVADRSQTPARPLPPDRKVTADHVWAHARLMPNNGSAQSGGQRTVANTASSPQGGIATPAYEIREVRLLRKVVFHQDPEPGKSKGNDATGEALYLFNEGENKVRMVVFNEIPKRPVSKDENVDTQRSNNGPTNKPVNPPASISTDDMSIVGPVIGMDQSRDIAWVIGPGTLVQAVDRGMLSDKNSPEQGANGNAKQPELKIQTRAGKPLSEKTELKITWTEKMNFFGRSHDFENRPNSAARAEFYGHISAITQEQDAVLDCTEKMITYTDRPVPLTKVASAAPSRGDASIASSGNQATEPKPQLAVIEMFGDAVAANRKVDPNRPLVLQKQRIHTDYLVYDRRTGQFTAPGEGTVYLYDRDGSGQGMMTPKVGDSNSLRVHDRLVIPTSMQQYTDEAGPAGDEMQEEPVAAEPTPRTPAPTADRGVPRVARTPQIRSTVPARAGDPQRSPGAQTKGDPKARQPKSATTPPLILTQIRFTREMRGRFGTGKGTDASEPRTAEFFGDIEVIRSPVSDEFGRVDRKNWAYRPPKDVYLLTAQTLRVITEQPPAGSPANTPAKHWLKAWETANLSTSDKILEADVITYNSENDQFYAYGEDGHTVTIAQESGPGQPPSITRQQAVRYHPKTQKSESVQPQTISWVDGKTGARPGIETAPDPEAKAKKRPRPPMKPRIPPMERKGFTGR